MTDFLDQLKQAEALAHEWLSFSEDAHGRDTREYADFVRCYFAANTNFRAVRFGPHGQCVEVYFHSPVQFNGLTHRAVERLDDILRHARDLLKQEREAATNRTTTEMQAERDALIGRLREQLAELEGGVAA